MGNTERAAARTDGGLKTIDYEMIQETLDKFAADLKPVWLSGCRTVLKYPSDSMMDALKSFPAPS